MRAERPKRKAIPDKIKLEVVLRQDGRCTHCGEKLGPLTGLNFDHRPAIINRDVNESGTDYVPPQLDPEHIEAIHEIPCHRERTIGRGGERRTTVAGSDIHTRDKTRRLEEKRLQREAREREIAEARRAMLAPSNYPIIEKTELDNSTIKRDAKPKRRLQSASRWPAKKPKTPFVRRGV